MGVSGGGPPPELEELYAAAYDRLVSVVAAVAGDRHDGEEAVQDAFVRLLGQWDRVSRYDDPEAWLRKVALGFVSNRRRKVRNGLRALLRTGPTYEALPGPGGDAVDVRRALLQLPHAQREVLVLHYFVGLDGPQIARQLELPLGTVKARLSRARRALAPALVEEMNDHA